ncbi:6712_t:CDS:1, partial [Dentiscutata heterogama]
ISNANIKTKEAMAQGVGMVINMAPERATDVVSKETKDMTPERAEDVTPEGVANMTPKGETDITER